MNQEEFIPPHKVNVSRIARILSNSSKIEIVERRHRGQNTMAWILLVGGGKHRKRIRVHLSVEEPSTESLEPEKND